MGQFLQCEFFSKVSGFIDTINRKLVPGLVHSGDLESQIDWKAVICTVGLTLQAQAIKGTVDRGMTSACSPRS
jgi:hypothetical protein